MLRTVGGFVALAAGVALCVKAGTNLLIPAAYVVAVFAVERQPSTQRYLLVLSLGMVVAVATAVAYASLAHRSTYDGIIVACGLILVCIGRLRRNTPP